MHPPIQTVDQGEEAELTCFSSTTPEWTFNKNQLPGNVLNYFDVLYIHEADINNHGLYECEGTTEEEYYWSGEKVKFYSRARIKVRSKS